MSLFNKAFAQATGGSFVLRIEDTDRARYVADSEQQIFETLRWLGLTWNEGPDVGGPYAPYRQSELLASGHAYHCWCSSQRLAELRAEQQASKASVTGYDRVCLGKTREQREALPGFSPTPVVRMLIPDDAPLQFVDVIRGQVVVDDHLMGITHVVRGEEWISSTPKHVLLYEFLGLTPPAFAHMPLLRNTDKSKISKRKNPAARLMWFREQGYLPEALRNFLQLLAYPPVGHSELATFDEFVAGFDWSKVNTVGPIFDLKKLDWLNGEYLRAMTPDELADRIVEHLTFTGEWSDVEPAKVDLLRRATPLIQERLGLLSEALGKLDFLFTGDDELVIADDARAQLGDDSAAVLDAAIDALEVTEPFDTPGIEAALRTSLIDGLGLKPRFAFGPVRVGITGSRVSPPLFESIELLGRASSLTRLRALRATL